VVISQKKGGALQKKNNTELSPAHTLPPKIHTQKTLDPLFLNQLLNQHRQHQANTSPKARRKNQGRREAKRRRRS